MLGLCQNYIIYSNHTKSAAAVSRITTGTAKRQIEIQINKAVRTVAGMRTMLLIPFSTMIFRPAPKKSNKIGGFVVKGNPKIRVKKFHCQGFMSPLPQS